LTDFEFFFNIAFFSLPVSVTLVCLACLNDPCTVRHVLYFQCFWSHGILPWWTTIQDILRETPVWIVACRRVLGMCFLSLQQLVFFGSVSGQILLLVFPSFLVYLACMGLTSGDLKNAAEPPAGLRSSNQFFVQGVVTTVCVSFSLYKPNFLRRARAKAARFFPARCVVPATLLGANSVTTVSSVATDGSPALAERAPTKDTILSAESSLAGGLAAELCKSYVHGALSDAAGARHAGDAAGSSTGDADGASVHPLGPALPSEPSFAWHVASMFSGENASVHSTQLGRARILNWCRAAQLFFEQELPAEVRSEITLSVQNAVDQTSRQCEDLYTAGEQDFEFAMQFSESRAWSGETLLEWILSAMVDPVRMPKTHELAVALAIILSNVLEPIVGASARLTAADPFATAFEDVTITTSTSATT